MDCLIGYYNDHFRNISGNVFEIFTAFYTADISPIESWLETQYVSKVVKRKYDSTVMRQEGNSFFAKKDLLKSLECYTKSLCLAPSGSTEYGLALANRSAVTFEMREFEDCLRDIDLCFATSYPNDLRPKIYIRQAECLLELNRQTALRKCVEAAQRFLNGQSINDKDKFIAKLKMIEEMKAGQHEDIGRDIFNETPDLPFGESPTLANASSKVRMAYNKTKGRHILTSGHIKRGEILFVEKAFIFAPVFKENKELYAFKCYNCLRDTISSVPCQHCSVCIYCDQKCRDKSWTACHQWECSGMQANIWYDLGIAFPAFKAMVKGAMDGFPMANTDFTDDLKSFGSHQNNYPYFYRLVSNIYKNKNMGPYIVMAATVVVYLQKYTNFFTWLLKQPHCPKKDEDSLAKYIGGLITKHIAQLACNSNTIEHWTSSSPELLFPDVLLTIACGIFPSVSIMNHSCRPNITYFFICDTIVVKALEDMPENTEVFNCYGIDYRGMSRVQRQYACKKLYHFDCLCVICSNPKKEVDMLNSYICPNCNGYIPDFPGTSVNFCMKCSEKFNLRPFRRINHDAQKYLRFNASKNQIELLIKSLKIREKILHKYHKDFEEVYYGLYTYYVEKGDAENMFKYFQFWLDNEKARRGDYSRGIGTKLYEAALAILHCLQAGSTKYCNSNLRSFLQNVEIMIQEAKVILNLYYPSYITNRLNKKIQFMSTMHK